MRLLRERCRESGIEANIDNFTDQVLKYRFRQLTVSDKLKIITCVHYKVAWSSINCVTVNNSVASPVSDCSNAYKIKKDHLRYLSSYNASEIRYRLKHYYKLMFVRHPFDRILSAWRDKLLIEMDQLYGHWGNYYRQWMPKILELIHPDWNVTRPDQLDKIRLPFADIVRWLQAGGYDMHTHGPYEDWCHPCQIQYDYIGKVETFDHDMNFIIDKKMKGRGKNTKNNVWDEHKNPAHFPFSKVLKEYRNVTLDMLDFLSSKYQKDFEQFGYLWKLDEKTRDVVAECSGDCC